MFCLQQAVSILVVPEMQLEQHLGLVGVTQMSNLDHSLGCVPFCVMKPVSVISTSSWFLAWTSAVHYIK